MSKYLVLAPILTLFALGLFITLRSGPAGEKPQGRLREIAENFWAMVIRVVCYAAGILMLEQILGMPSLVSMSW